MNTDIKERKAPRTANDDEWNETIMDLMRRVALLDELMYAAREKRRRSAEVIAAQMQQETAFELSGTQ